MQPNNYMNQNLKSGFKHKKLVIVLIILFTLFFVLPLFILAWMGFVPGLSNILGASKAKDLGVRYSPSDLQAYEQKAKIEFKSYDLAPENPYNSSQKNLLTTPQTTQGLNISQSELTSAINNMSWNWLPTKNMQVRLSNDTIEISGNLDSKKIENLRTYLRQNGKNTSDANNAINWAKKVTNSAPIYLRANVSITDNILRFRLTNAQIGRMTIPLGNLGDALASSSYTNIHADNFDAKSLKLSSGKLEFNGTYPSVIYIK